MRFIKLTKYELPIFTTSATLETVRESIEDYPLYVPGDIITKCEIVNQSMYNMVNAHQFASGLVEEIERLYGTFTQVTNMFGQTFEVHETPEQIELLINELKEKL